MALIKTIAEIRAVIPRMSSLSNTANLPNVDKAARLHIVPVIGKALYNEMEAAYNATMSAEQTKLLKHIQLPLAAFALLGDLAFIHAVITDNGIRTNSNPNMEAAHRWEYKELEDALKTYAADGIEILLDHLYENKTSFASWTNSNEFKELDAFLIKSGTEFSKYYTLSQPLRTFWNLKPTIDLVEENYLASVFGRDLVKWIKDQEEILINITGAQIDVKKDLKKAVAYLTIKHAGETLAVQFGADGFTVMAGGGSRESTTDGKAPAGAIELNKKLEAANRDGQNYLKKVVMYLTDIAAGKHGDTLKTSIATAFETSPLNVSEDDKLPVRKNDQRKIFVF